MIECHWHYCTQATVHKWRVQVSFRSSQLPAMPSKRFHLNKLFATKLCGSDGMTIVFSNEKQDVIMKPLARGATMSMPTPF